LLGGPNFRRRLGRIELRRIEIVLAGKVGYDAPDEPQLTKDETDKVFRDHIGLNDTAKKHAAQSETQSPVGWTGQPMPVGGLMLLAVEKPKAFCRLLLAVTLPPMRRSRSASRG
jgi:hypothetical protein